MNTRPALVAAVAAVASVAAVTGCSASQSSTSTAQSAVASATAMAGSTTGSASTATSGSGTSTAPPATSPTASGTAMATGSAMSMSAQLHTTDGGAPPAGIVASTRAKYPVGSKVVLTADHMPGMQGATATVVGAYDTVAYAVDYTPTTGGGVVKDHKWVVQQEIQGAGSGVIPNGTSVTLTADHMSGMQGAKATIVSSTTEPVYMVDYTTMVMTVKNHKWVVESELKPAG